MARKRIVLLLDHPRFHSLQNMNFLWKRIFVEISSYSTTLFYLGCPTVFCRHWTLQQYIRQFWVCIILLCMHVWNLLSNFYHALICKIRQPKECTECCTFAAAGNKHVLKMSALNRYSALNTFLPQARKCTWGSFININTSNTQAMQSSLYGQILRTHSNLSFSSDWSGWQLFEF